MKQLSIIFSLLVFVSVYSLAQRPADKFERRVYHADNDSIQYRLFIPELVDSTIDLFPLIMTIHGSGEIGNDNNIHIITLLRTCKIILLPRSLYACHL